MRTALLLAFALFLVTPPAAQAAREVCGVDVSRDRSCWRQLRRLKRACQSTMTLCGQSFSKQGVPSFKRTKASCRRLWVKDRRRWITGLCGVALFSGPRTYCGLKGIEVAVACVKANTANRTATAAAAPEARHSQPQALKVRKSAQRVSSATGPKARETKTTTPAPQSPATEAKREDPATGQLSTSGTKGSSGGASSGWSYFLQFLILLLLFYGFFLRRSGGNNERQWSSEARWDNGPLERWNQMQQVSLDSHTPDTNGLYKEDVLQVIEESMHRWTERIDQQKSQVDLPAVTQDPLQQKAESLHKYYTRLAKRVVEMSVPAQFSPAQSILREAQEQLEWIFQSHREPFTSASFVQELHTQVIAQTNSLLSELGHIDPRLLVEQHMSTGQFNFDTFLQRKEEDQARLFLTGQEPESFDALQEEFFQCIEQLYRSNLRSISEVATQPMTMSGPEQDRLLHERYVQQFLHQDLLGALQVLTRKSTPERIGALLDQLLHFVEDQIQTLGYYFTPAPTPEHQESLVGRLQYMLGASLEFGTAPPAAEAAPQAQRVVQTATYDSDAPQTDDEGLIASFASSPGLQHPDSTPPEAQQSREDLMMAESASLPLLQVSTQSFVEAAPDPQPYVKVTREYAPLSSGPEQHSQSPEKNS